MERIKKEKINLLKNQEQKKLVNYIKKNISKNN